VRRLPRNFRATRGEHAGAMMEQRPADRAWLDRVRAQPGHIPQMQEE
jgi:hypothetical protein